MQHEKERKGEREREKYGALQRVREELFIPSLAAFQAYWL